MQEQPHLARSVYHAKGSVELTTVKCADEHYEMRLGGDANITMPLFLLTGRTIPRQQRLPIETVGIYYTATEALQGHQRADVMLQQLYGGPNFTITPEPSET